MCVCVVSPCRPHETVVPLEDPIVTEVTSTLQEWALLWKQLYVVSSSICFFTCVFFSCITLQRHWSRFTSVRKHKVITPNADH